MFPCPGQDLWIFNHITTGAPMLDDMAIKKQKEILKQIEIQIGKKLEPVPLKEIKGSKNGFAIDKAGNVVGLNLYNCNIKHIPDLSGFSELIYLSLANNKITNLIPLSSLTKLKKLRLQNNHIKDLTPLNTLTNLSGLWLNTNQITDLTPLSALTNLKHLYLIKNKIIEVSPLSSLKKYLQILLPGGLT